MIPKKIKEARKWSWLKLDNKLEPAKSKKYITEEEQKKCKIIAGVFNDLFKHEDLLVLDAGRYGFVKLMNHDRTYGFRDVESFRSSQELFDDLWKEWVFRQLSSLINNSSLAELDYEDIFKSLPPHVAEKVNRKKIRLLNRIDTILDNEKKKWKLDFCVKITMQRIAATFGNERVKPENMLMPVKGRHHTTMGERGKCRKVASAFKDLYEHEDLLVLDAGRYGFVKLQDYTIQFGFRYIDTFRNSHDLFEDLWEEWISSQMTSLTSDSPLEYLNSDDILKSLPPQVMKRVNRKKRRFMKEAGLIPQKRKIKGIWDTYAV